MKKFLLLAVLLITSAVYASAQYKDYYITEEVGSSNPSMYWIRIDWNNKFFFIDGDGENDGPIKNYKESGNKRTFDAWYPVGSGINEKVYSVVFTDDGDNKYTISLTLSNGHKLTFKATTKKPVKSGGGGGSNSAQDKIQSMKDAVGKGLNKGVDAIKKKQQENKAKKEAKKN